MVSLLSILFPVRKSFVQIEDWVGETKGHFIEERNGHTKVLLNRCLMVESHGNDQIRFLDQLST